MISLGGIGTFYQLYKIIFPTFFNQSPLQDIANNGPTREFRDVFGMDSAALDLMIIFGVIGLLISVFYIIGGAKLLSAKPTNYHFAKYALLIFNYLQFSWSNTFLFTFCWSISKNLIDLIFGGSRF